MTELDPIVLEVQLNVALMEIERLKAALKKYGCHTFECNIAPEHPSCDCGWADIIADVNCPSSSNEQ